MGYGSSLRSKFVVLALEKVVLQCTLLCACHSEFMKVVEVALVQIMGFVEDERTFTTLTFIKT
jgi:hypothetical protein